jgi:hypothetical protein
MLVNIERMGDSKITMQQLKEQRLTPAEKFILDKVKGVIPSEPDELVGIRFADKDGIVLFQQVLKFGVLYVNFFGVWSVLEKQYGLNHSEIQKLIKNVMYKHTNNGKLTPKVMPWIATK